jgi:hypothetical protein
LELIAGEDVTCPAVGMIHRNEPPLWIAYTNESEQPNTTVPSFATAGDEVTGPIVP